MNDGIGCRQARLAISETSHVVRCANVGSCLRNKLGNIHYAPPSRLPREVGSFGMEQHSRYYCIPGICYGEVDVVYPHGWGLRPRLQSYYCEAGPQNQIIGRSADTYEPLERQQIQLKIVGTPYR